MNKLLLCLLILLASSYLKASGFISGSGSVNVDATNTVSSPDFSSGLLVDWVITGSSISVKSHPNPSSGATDIALGANQCAFTVNGLICEGATNDSFESRIQLPDAAGADFALQTSNLGGTSQQIVGETATQTLTNKTITSAILDGLTAISTMTLNGNTIRGSTTAVTINVPSHIFSAGDFMVTSSTQTSTAKKTFGELVVTSIFTMPSNAAPQANVIPNSVGQLIVNTGATPDEVCFATAAVVASWVRISTPTATCSN